MSPFDLHVLGAPPAFVLSQDQTLRFIQARNLQNQAQKTYVPRTRPRGPTRYAAFRNHKELTNPSKPSPKAQSKRANQNHMAQDITDKRPSSRRLHIPSPFQRCPKSFPKRPENRGFFGVRSAAAASDGAYMGVPSRAQHLSRFFLERRPTAPQRAGENGARSISGRRPATRSATKRPVIGPCVSPT